MLTVICVTLSDETTTVISQTAGTSLLYFTLKEQQNEEINDTHNGEFTLQLDL